MDLIAMQDINKHFAEDYLAESLAGYTCFATDAFFARKLRQISEAITGAFSRRARLLIAGNGGSAADAQHMAGEFVARLMFDRAPLAAIALTTDTTALTAIGNDYGYDAVFERQVRALGQSGDVFLGISTSGQSTNVLRALEAARLRNITTIGFTGAGGGPMRELCDLMLEAPSNNTAIIQQIHITAIHVVCAMVERALFLIEPEPAHA